MKPLEMVLQAAGEANAVMVRNYKPLDIVVLSNQDGQKVVVHWLNGANQSFKVNHGQGDVSVKWDDALKKNDSSALSVLAAMIDDK